MEKKVTPVDLSNALTAFQENYLTAIDSAHLDPNVYKALDNIGFEVTEVFRLFTDALSQLNRNA